MLVIENPSWGSPQPCRKFGINPNMPFLRELYNSGDVAFIANMGNLVEPLTLAEYNSGSKKLPLGIGAHNIQSKAAETLNAADPHNTKGLIGQMLSHFSSKGEKVSGFSVNGAFSLALDTFKARFDSQIIMEPKIGTRTFNEDKLNDYIEDYVLII